MRKISKIAFSNKNGKVKIKKYEKKLEHIELNWTEEEFNNLSARILKLRDDQLGALACLAVRFSIKDLNKIIKEIRKFKENSTHLPIIIYEAPSKKFLLFWLNFFEKKG